MTMALTDTNERLVSKINHKSLGPIVVKQCYDGVQDNVNYTWLAR